MSTFEKWVESEEFDHIAYQYRATPMHLIGQVRANFDALKSAIIAQHKAALAQGEPVVDVHDASKCQPTLTECPRCRNDVQKCDGLFKHFAPPTPESSSATPITDALFGARAPTEAGDVGEPSRADLYAVGLVLQARIEELEAHCRLYHCEAGALAKAEAELAELKAYWFQNAEPRETEYAGEFNKALVDYNTFPKEGT